MKFFLPSPSGPAPLSVLLEGFYPYQIQVSFKLLAKLLNGIIPTSTTKFAAVLSFLATLSSIVAFLTLNFLAFAQIVMAD